MHLLCQYQAANLPCAIDTPWCTQKISRGGQFNSRQAGNCSNDTEYMLERILLLPGLGGAHLRHLILREPPSLVHVISRFQQCVMILICTACCLYSYMTKSIGEKLDFPQLPQRRVCASDCWQTKQALALKSAIANPLAICLMINPPRSTFPIYLSQIRTRWMRWARHYSKRIVASKVDLCVEDSWRVQRE